MVNLRYPSGLKGKSSIAWLGMIAVGFSPFFFFFSGYLAREHYTGLTHRQTYGEERYYQLWMNSNFRHQVFLREALNAHPNYRYSLLDSKRLRIGSLQDAKR